MIIKRLKSKFKTLDKRVQANKQVAQDQLALIQLLKMFNHPIFIPLTTWSINPITVQHICNDIVINKRKNIIEYGSGFSTLCIAKLMELKNIEANFYSVENNKEWHSQMTKQIDELNLSNYVTLVYAPITNVNENISLPEQKKWYSTDALDNSISNVDKVDLVIVDGPYGGTTPYARYSAIPYVKEKLRNSFSIFLDDTARLDEQKILELWSSDLKHNFINYKRYSVITSCLEYSTTPINM